MSGKRIHIVLKAAAFKQDARGRGSVILDAPATTEYPVNPYWPRTKTAWYAT
jgi:hypothetical protein